MIETAVALPAVLKLMADPTRLRILALLDADELSVGELSRSLGMAQSRVSNHLRLLREANLLVERHSGTSTFLRLACSGENGDVAGRLWATLRAELDSMPEHAADLVRLDALRAAREGSEGFFDRLAGEWDKIAGAFRTGQARQRAAVHLLPTDYRVADLGCGTGYMAQGLLGQVSQLVCVDLSQGMLDEARSRLEPRARQTRVEYRRGALDALPLEDGEVDGVVAGMVLHHLPQLEPAVAEMRRVLRPGGNACVLELAPHKETWMLDELGDRHLGLDSADVMAAFRRVGFEGVTLDPVDDTYQPQGPDGSSVSLSLYIVRGTVPRT